MVLGTAAIPLGASLLANTNRLKNERVKITAQNQAALDQYKDDQKSWDLGKLPIQLTDFESPKPTDFYATSNNPTINLTGHGPTGPSDSNVKDYLGGLYQGAFDRNPEFNNDPSNTADYWVDAVSKGQHGDRDWKEWLAASVYGSDEKKGMSSIETPATDTPATNTSTTDTTTNTNTDTAAASTGLTLDDLNSWWDTKQSKQPDKFDQFTEFMGLMGGMGGMFGGGVPGFASGGVAAASPYNNFMGFMNAFKNMGGNSQQENISTGNTNVG